MIALILVIYFTGMLGWLANYGIGLTDPPLYEGHKEDKKRDAEMALYFPIWPVMLIVVFEKWLGDAHRVANDD